jgi:hypothetical protein
MSISWCVCATKFMMILIDKLLKLYLRQNNRKSGGKECVSFAFAYPIMDFFSFLD